MGFEARNLITISGEKMNVIFYHAEKGIGRNNFHFFKLG